MHDIGYHEFSIGDEFIVLDANNPTSIQTFISDLLAECHSYFTNAVNLYNNSFIQFDKEYKIRNKIERNDIYDIINNDFLKEHNIIFFFKNLFYKYYGSSKAENI